jgi:hypothetical protein
MSNDVKVFINPSNMMYIYQDEGKLTSIHFVNGIVLGVKESTDKVYELMNK